MTNILPTLAVASAALCVWLGVRIVNRRERWAIWLAVLLVGAIAVCAAYRYLNRPGLMKFYDLSQ